MLILKKNEPTAAQRTFEFPLVSSGDAEALVTGATPTITVSGEGSQAGADNAATEIGSSGIYTWEMSQAEANVDYGSVTIQATGAITLVIPFVTRTQDIDDLSVPTAAQIADQVWDETLGDHAATDSTGAALDAAGGYTIPTAAQIADQVWDEASADHGDTGSMGALQNLLSRLGTVSITVTSPVATDGDVDIIQGDTYATADGRALVWTSASYTGPSLVDATAKFRAIPSNLYEKGSGEASLDKAATIGIDGDTVTFTVELTAAETGDLDTISPRTYAYEIEVTLASGNVYTYAQGTMTVTRDVTPES